MNADERKATHRSLTREIRWTRACALGLLLLDVALLLALVMHRAQQIYSFEGP